MTEIITDGFPKDGSEQILLEEVTCKYVQNADCTENRDDVQEIVLSTRDGGGGKFININTKNWSISGIEDLCKLIKDFEQRVGINHENISNT